MRCGRTWPWVRMRPFLARFSEPVWSGRLLSWADCITTTPELKFSVHTPDLTRLLLISPGSTRDLAADDCTRWNCKLSTYPRTIPVSNYIADTGRIFIAA